MEESFRDSVDTAFGSMTAPEGVSSAVWRISDEEIGKSPWQKHREESDDRLGADRESEPSSFKDRVDKVFGSLRSSATATQAVTSALWCLSDDEIERSYRSRDTAKSDYAGRECEPSFEDDTEYELEDLGDVVEDEETDGDKNLKRNQSLDEYLEVQSIIGRDCTLDYEEEEDEYDKFAVGIEQRNSFRSTARDLRADHAAAQSRLKEDVDSSGNLEDADNVRSILKRKENQVNPNLRKRVRFVLDSGTSKDEPPSEPRVDVAETPAKDDTSKSDDPSLPDYLRNPSRYTRYTFHSAEDMDDQSNQKAYLEFFQYLRKREDSDPMEDKATPELPKSIVFTPRRSQTDETVARGSSSGDTSTGDENLKHRSLYTMAEEDEQGADISAMEEDEPMVSASSSGKLNRKYRSRSNTSGDDNVYM